MVRWKYVWGTCTSHGRHPRTNRHSPTQQHTTYNQKKHKTPSPWSPQATSFQRLQFYRWVRLPYATQLITIIATRQCTFIDNNNFSFIYLTIILCAVAQCAHWLKVSFYRYILCFFCAAALKWRTNPSYLAIYYLAMLREKSSCFSLILDRGRGGAIVTMFSGSKR